MPLVIPQVPLKRELQRLIIMTRLSIPPGAEVMLVMEPPLDLMKFILDE